MQVLKLKLTGHARKRLRKMARRIGCTESETVAHAIALLEHCQRVAQPDGVVFIAAAPDSELKRVPMPWGDDS